MKRTCALALATVVQLTGTASAQLMLTGIFDGPLSRGTPKGIELHVTEDIDDLAIFSIGSANNGEGSDGAEYTLPSGTADEGQFLYIASEEVGFEEFFGFAPDFTSGSMLINGDDAVELFAGDEVLDVFGDINVKGTDEPWEYTDGWAYRDDQAVPNGGNFDIDDWVFSGPDALDGETDNDSANSPVPIGSYTYNSLPVGETGALQPGDADRDFDFDQLDLVKVQVASKYLTGEFATWGDGDWDGGPGGLPGSPPAGNGRFDQLDIVAALNAGVYLTGPYGAVRAGGISGDGQTSIGYDSMTGQVWIDAPAGVELTSVNIDSTAGIFVEQPAESLGGSFDNDADGNLFKATFGGSFGSISFGNVAQTGLSEQFLQQDLSVVGSLAGGGELGNVDLIFVPEPAGICLMLIGLFGIVAGTSRRN